MVHLLQRRKSEWGPAHLLQRIRTKLVEMGFDPDLHEDEIDFLDQLEEYMAKKKKKTVLRLLNHVILIIDNDHATLKQVKQVLERLRDDDGA